MILVTGATGNIGRRVTEGLALEGRAVRALVRDPAAVEAFEAMGVNALVGDITRAEDRAAALVDIEEVLCCHGAYHGAGDENVLAVDGDATVALISEAQAAGAKRFVLLSHVAVDKVTGAARFEAKRRAEAALAGQSVMRYIVLRLAPLMTALTELPGFRSPGRDGGFLIFGRGENRISPVAPADVATIVRRCGRAYGENGLVYEVGGPETFAWNELPAVFERASGASIVTWRMPLFFLTVARWILSLVNRPAGERLAYYEALYRCDMAVDPTRVIERFGIELQDLESFLADAFEAVAPAPVEVELGALAAADPEPPPLRSVESARPTSPLEDDLPEPPRRETESPTPPEPDLELPDDEPEPKLELPPATAEAATAELPEHQAVGIEWIGAAAETKPADGWGTQVEFGGPPTPAEDAPVAKRPPVERPDAVQDPVVDLDQDTDPAD